MSVIPFSQALRDRTRASTDDGPGAAFMRDLMTGKGTRDDYIALVSQQYFVYQSLEAAGAAFAADQVAARFLTPQLTRLPAIEEDLHFLLGSAWRSGVRALPTTERYVRRIAEVTNQRWTGGFVAHHYTRYLGDLSGGQAIRGLMQRQFGFETNGVGFFLFDQIAKPKEFKRIYREQLDAVDWDETERERVIAEVGLAYRFTTELFVDLATARSVA